MTRLLLGLLDKALLRLGDNTSVNFERSMIFLTSNLGARAMRKELCPDFGFEALMGSSVMEQGSPRGSTAKLASIGMGEVRRKFSPEFVNRIDAVITYQPLSAESLNIIFDQQIAALDRHIRLRLEERAFAVEMSAAARAFLLRLGTSAEFGARELKRTIMRKLTQPLAAMVETGKVPPGSCVLATLSGEGDSLDLAVEVP
jgi:ATP-dependent Clp protease ATP-binding subunit ClpA